MRTPLLTQSDFVGVGQVAKHCDLEKLNQAILEAEDFDLSNLFCDFWTDIVQDWIFTEDSGIPDEDWDLLINGGTFEGCNGKEKRMMGVKKVLVYYAYSRYIILNGFNDTPSGMVQKTNEFSMPTPLKELQAYSDKYRNMGLEAYKGVENYLCLNRDIWISFQAENCKRCGCNGTCGKGTTNKGFGFKAGNISK